MSEQEVYDALKKAVEKIEEARASLDTMLASDLPNPMPLIRINNSLRDSVASLRVNLRSTEQALEKKGLKS